MSERTEYESVCIRAGRPRSFSIRYFPYSSQGSHLICTVRSNDIPTSPLFVSSIVVPTADNLFATTADQNCMLELSNMTPLSINKRSITLHDALIDQLLHCKMILLHSQALEIPTTEDNAAKVIVNSLEQRLCSSGQVTRNRNVVLTSVAVDADLYTT